MLRLGMTGESSELAYVVAARAALQMLSAFGWVLQDEEDNRHVVSDRQTLPLRRRSTSEHPIPMPLGCGG